MPHSAALENIGGHLPECGLTTLTTVSLVSSVQNTGEACNQEAMQGTVLVRTETLALND